MPTSTRPPFFSSEFLAQLERLTLASRRTFRGRVKGERRSPRKGHSVEFCDYRAYGIGDDLRYVDWNIYSRLDRLHVKLFVDEEDLCLHLLVDASKSMDFGAPTKLDYALRLGGALGFVGLVNLERVGVAVLRERAAEGWPPARGRNQFPALVDFLTDVRAAGGTSLNAALAGYAMRAREPGLAVVISDLLDPGGYETGLRALLEHRFDVHVIHVLDAEEMNPALAGDLRMEDSETGEVRELTLDGETIREYRQRLHQYLDRVEGFCRSQEIGYRRVTTDTPLEEFVLSQLRGLVIG
ncbi:MAG: DUF58 domain-containing protein [Candidatus Rokubacteria bacterium]|nr:DUF58 domain-containing protein [Candidatus Rokubacteria bacterium]MBI3827160.1 DUF58 domain-containing protein [Candidatus Rokubacteria bacterium]